MALRQRIGQALMALSGRTPDIAPGAAAAALMRSLRDAAVTSETTGVMGVIDVSGTGATERLFRKQQVPMLRAYAEYSVWVRAAINIYRNVVGRATWQLAAADATRPMSAAVETEVTALLQHPNPANEPYTTMKEKMIEDYLVLGHGALEFLINADTTPYQILPVDAATIGMVDGWDGSDPTKPRYAQLGSNGKVLRYIPDSMMMCLVNTPRSYDLLGLSHVEVLDIAVRTLLESDNYLLEQILYPMPGGALNLGEGAKQRQIDEVRSHMEMVKKALIVIGASQGASFMRMDTSAAQLKVLDTQVWFVRQVAAIFGVSTAALRLAVDTSRANTREMFENDQEGPGALLARLRDLENAKIVNTWGDVERHNVRLDYPIMSRKDEQQQTDMTAKQLGAGQAWVSLNEGRRDAGKDELDKKKFPSADEVLIATPDGPVPLSVMEARWERALTAALEPPPVPPPGPTGPPKPGGPGTVAGTGTGGEPGAQGEPTAAATAKGAPDAVTGWSMQEVATLARIGDDDVSRAQDWFSSIAPQELRALLNAKTES